MVFLAQSGMLKAKMECTTHLEPWLPQAVFKRQVTYRKILIYRLTSDLGSFIVAV